ncbi:MAG: MobV family relaxase, partial [Suipraeoptans sp.]
FRFACERFGKENIVEFAIHLDERTPHIHCVVVPLTADGRLSAKEVMGNRTKMTELQEMYGVAMCSYNLDRGVKGSKATHDSIQEYYARINQRMNPEPYKKIEIAIQDIPKIEKPPLIGREKWVQQQNKTILSKIKNIGSSIVVEYNKRTENSLKIAQNEKLQAQEKESRLRKINAQLKGVIKEQDKMINPEKYTKQEIKQERENNRGRGMRR